MLYIHQPGCRFIGFIHLMNRYHLGVFVVQTGLCRLFELLLLTVLAAADTLETWPHGLDKYLALRPKVIKYSPQIQHIAVWSFDFNIQYTFQLKLYNSYHLIN